MTLEKDIFLNIDTTFNSKVKVGDGATVKVKGKGKGSIVVDTKKGKKVIGDVIFVPVMDQSLLSVGKLLEHRYILQFEGEGCKIYDQGRENIVVAKVENGILYNFFSYFQVFKGC